MIGKEKVGIFGDNLGWGGGGGHSIPALSVPNLIKELKALEAWAS